jgi:hypothetical protein
MTRGGCEALATEPYRSEICRAEQLRQFRQGKQVIPLSELPAIRTEKPPCLLVDGNVRKVSPDLAQALQRAFERW